MSQAKVRTTPWVLGLLAALILVGLGYWYLSPASGLALAQDVRYLLSEGGDGNTVPFHHWTIQRWLREQPSYLFYGTVYTPQLNPPTGYGMWIPWIERLVGAVLGGFFTAEGMGTLYPWVLMVLNGFLLYLFGMRARWPWAIALAAGICFAFNPYTRARSIAHDSLVGLYYLPATFLALQALRRVENWRASRPKLVEASLWFLLAATCAHYYLMITVAIAPFLLWYALRLRAHKGRAFAQLATAALPAIAFLAWNLLAPLPPGLSTDQAVHKPPIASYWLVTFSARPIDYLSGDIGFDASDVNPLRSAITHGIRERAFDMSNNLERANGIRWLALAIFAMGAYAVLRRRKQKLLPEGLRLELVFFVAFAAGAYWLSLSPRSLAPGGVGIGPSLLVHKIFPHFRVPSRFGPVVHFSVLVVMGYCLTTWISRLGSHKLRAALLAITPIWAVIEYFPVHPVWAIPAQPDRRELVLPGTNHCGTGVFFPYVGVRTGSAEEFEFYKTIQQMKRTPCVLANLPIEDRKNAAMYARFGTDRYAQDAEKAADEVIAFLRCSRFDWVVFRPETSPAIRTRVCAELGWRRTRADSCRSPEPASSPTQIEACL